jgi:hypothetical protein
MFPIVKERAAFEHWIDSTEGLLAKDSRMSFLVGFVSFERYYRRLTMPLALPTPEADGRNIRAPRMYDLWSRLEQCYVADPLRWVSLVAALSRLGVDGERLNDWRDLRNGIVHGEHELKQSEIAAEAKALWKLLRILGKHPIKVRGVEQDWSAFSRRPPRNPVSNKKKNA